MTAFSKCALTMIYFLTEMSLRDVYEGLWGSEVDDLHLKHSGPIYPRCIGHHVGQSISHFDQVWLILSLFLLLRWASRVLKLFDSFTIEAWKWKRADLSRKEYMVKTLTIFFMFKSVFWQFLVILGCFKVF